jgi:hypothetical protein
MAYTKYDSVKELRTAILNFLETLDPEVVTTKSTIAKKVNVHTCSVHLEQALKTVRIRRLQARHEIGKLGDMSLMLSHPINFYQSASRPTQLKYTIFKDERSLEDDLG